MSWRVHPQEFLARQNSAMLPTIPERPETIQNQMGQLANGKRRVVMIPRGTKMPSRIPKHLKTIHIPRSGNFIFHPSKIGPKEIRKAVTRNKLPEILGAADGGMGAPDKTQLAEPISAVIGTDASGNTTQGTLTDEANMPSALEQTAKLTPDDGNVEVADPETEIRRRQWNVAPEDFLNQAVA